MSSNRLKIQIVGRPEDNEDVRFDDFLNQLTAVKKALTEVDRVVTNGGESVYYRVVDLNHSSTAAVVLEAVPVNQQEADNSEIVLEKFLTGISLIQAQKVAPDDFDYNVLQALKQITTPVGSKIAEMIFSSNGTSVPLSNGFAQSIDNLIGLEVEVKSSKPLEGGLLKLSELRGVAKGALGNKSTEEYLAELRDEW